MSKVVLDVPEISCEHCSQTITNVLKPQAGVQKVQVDVPTHKVHLEYDEGKISLERVKKILEDEEYPVEAVSAA